MTALPVDYRRCREDRCADGAGEGVVGAIELGEPAGRLHPRRRLPAEAAAATEAAGADCSGQRAGNLYLQYWFYYPGSATAEGSTFLKRPIRTVSSKLGHSTHHPDDWEAYMVRIGPAGRFARASSHHGYSYEIGPGLAGYSLRRNRAGAWTVAALRRRRSTAGARRPAPSTSPAAATPATPAPARPSLGPPRTTA